MKLTRVTITGADDKVDPEALSGLSTMYPFVEWGILFSESREGQERYPSFEWRERLERVWEQNPAMKLSAHLCGSLARRTLMGNEGWIRSASSCPYMRVQLNGFGRSGYDGLRKLALTHESRQWILQAVDSDTLERAYALYRLDGPLFAILHDASGGTGTAPRSWPVPLPMQHVAYAGGITLENLEETVATLSRLQSLEPAEDPKTFGVDLETGARTDDQFDLRKAALILSKASYLGAGQ